MKKEEVSRVEPPVVAADRLDLSRKPQPDGSRHTPGPWLRDGQIVYALHHNGDYVKGSPLLVNRFSAQVESCVNQGGTREEAEANAHLIAAAPDLLAALQDITFRFATVCAATGDFSEANAKALDAASVVMQKALGEA